MHPALKRSAPEAILGAGFVAVRLAVTVTRPVYREPDTPGYFRLRWWGGVRLPTVPLLYTTVSNARAIVVVQAVLGAFAWVLAAVVLLGPVRHRLLRLAAAAGTGVLGVSAPVINWDDALLSESLSISLALLLVVAVIAALRRPTRGRVAAAWGLGLAWALVRQNNVILLAFAAVVLGVLSARASAPTVLRRLALGFAAIGVLGLVLSTSNHDVAQENVAQLVVRRVLPDDAARTWFLDHGMPAVDEGLRAPDTIQDDEAVFAATAAIRRDPAFAAWLREDGEATYARYLATHPTAVVAPLVEEHDIWHAAGTGTVTAVPGHPPWHVVPWLLEVALWPDRSVVVALDAAIVAALTAFAWSRRHRRPAAVDGRAVRRVLVAVVALAACNVPVVVSTAGAEYGRLFMTTGTLVRLALVVAVTAGLDRALGPGDPGATTLSE